MDLTSWLPGPEAGLAGLTLASFLSATVLPGGSEALLFAFLKLNPDQVGPALLLATIGNTLGGLTSYWGGMVLPGRDRVTRVPRIELVRRFGSASLLLAWAPLIGDALCVAAGWLRLNWIACAAYMAAGKFARYWVVAQSVALV